MILYYMDSSAWIKRHYQEAGTVWINQLFTQNPPLACATLGLIEVLATLARKCKAGSFDRPVLEQKIQEVDREWQKFIQIELDGEALGLAQALVQDGSLRGADAIHLAAALLLQKYSAEDNDQVTLVTSDQELKKAAQGSGLAILDPVEAEQQIPNKPSG